MKCFVGVFPSYMDLIWLSLGLGVKIFLAWRSLICSKIRKYLISISIMICIASPGIDKDIASKV